jgi:hypothetical protein
MASASFHQDRLPPKEFVSTSLAQKIIAPAVIGADVIERKPCGRDNQTHEALETAERANQRLSRERGGALKKASLGQSHHDGFRSLQEVSIGEAEGERRSSSMQTIRAFTAKNRVGRFFAAA